MFSLPLFKQSLKATWVSWIVVTTATCFMLALILSVVGRDSVNHVLSSLGQAYAEEAIESQVEHASMSQYMLTSSAIEGFDDQIEFVQQAAPSIVSGYHMVISQDDDPSEQEIESAIQTIVVNAPEEHRAFIEPFLYAYAFRTEADKTPEGIASEVLIELMVETLYQKFLNEGQEVEAAQMEQYLRTTLYAYHEQEALDGVAFATMATTTTIKATMAEPLSEYGMTEDRIGELASEAILSFRAQLEVRYPNQSLSEIEEEQVSQLINQLSRSSMDGFPEHVKENLADMQSLDLAQLMTGSIFFKMAGLLIPVIYIILLANSLIADQVDSGSMAYILSTPTKRRAVTMTQIAFMVFSLLVMCLITTATGVLILTLVEASTISYRAMVLLNLGLFMTLFAFSGFCFFASAWFNRSKHALAVGGGISMYFVVATILGLFGSPAMPSVVRMDAMNLFNFTTITYFFDTSSILDGTNDFIWKLIALAVFGLIFYVIGITRFNRKDLPL